MNLQLAQQHAARLVDQMAPFCSKCEIAGSVRRQKEDCRDIEIVCVPTWNESVEYVGLFGEEKKSHTNLLFEWALSGDCSIKWIKPSTSDLLEWKPVADGRYWRGLLPDGQTKLDLFITTADNFGMQMLVRTGSKDFSQAIATYARDYSDYQLAGGYLTQGGRDIPTPDEKDVFDLLGLRYIEPQERHGWAQVVRL